MAERSISARPCWWTKWDAKNEVSPLVYVYHHHRHSRHCIFRTTISAKEEHRISAMPCGWTKWDAKNEVSPLVYVYHHHRHSRHCIFRTTISAKEEHRISAMPCGWTKWDTKNEVSPLVCVHHHHRHSQHCIFIEQRYRWWRSAASRRGLAGEPSETLGMKFPRKSMSTIITDTHNTGSFTQQMSVKEERSI